MKYRNVRNGAVIETNCRIEGGGWRPLGDAGQAPEEQQEPEKEIAPVQQDEADDDDSDLEVQDAPAETRRRKK